MPKNAANDSSFRPSVGAGDCVVVKLAASRPLVEARAAERARDQANRRLVAVVADRSIASDRITAQASCLVAGAGKMTLVAGTDSGDLLLLNICKSNNAYSAYVPRVIR